MTKQRTRPLLPSEAKAVQRRIEEWRRTRRSGSPMPEELWAAAAALARKHGTYVIARGLPVDYGALKKRVEREQEESGGESVATVASTDAGATAGPTGFVELDAARLFGRAREVGPVVELARPDGARLVVRLPAGVSLDTLGLAIAFCGGGA